MTENNSMGFLKEKKSLEEIVMTLAVSGINVKNKCMFISDDNTANIIKSLLKHLIYLNKNKKKCILS